MKAIGAFMFIIGIIAAAMGFGVPIVDALYFVGVILFILLCIYLIFGGVWVMLFGPWKLHA